MKPWISFEKEWIESLKSIQKTWLTPYIDINKKLF